MVKTHLAGAAASVARDDVAPESGQDDPLREKQHLRGTSGTRFDWCSLTTISHAVLRDRCLSVDEPIQGSTPALRHPWLAHHIYPEALIDLLRCLHALSMKHSSIRDVLLIIWFRRFVLQTCRPYIWSRRISLVLRLA